MEEIQRKLLIQLLFTLFIIIIPSIHATDFKYCKKKKDYAVKISDVVISPDPIRKGKETSFVISAFTDEALSGGKVEIDVAYFGWNVYSKTGDLCANLSCPVPVGNFVISYSQLLPTFAPPGSYTLTLKMEDGNRNELTCIKFDFSIGFFGSKLGLTDS